MKSAYWRGRLLLWVHLAVCLVWLCVVRSDSQPPGWMMHVVFWSILGVQFTWGYTVGLLVGPSRARRRQLWWSLLTVFMPLYPISFIFRLLAHFLGLRIALIYLAVFVMILACETFCGVWLGCRRHAREG